MPMMEDKSSPADVIEMELVAVVPETALTKIDSFLQFSELPPEVRIMIVSLFFVHNISSSC